MDTTKLYNAALNAVDRVPFLILIAFIIALGFVLSIAWLRAGERKDKTAAEVFLAAHAERSKLRTRVSGGTWTWSGSGGGSGGSGAPAAPADPYYDHADLMDLVPAPISAKEAFDRFNHKGGSHLIGDKIGIMGGGALTVRGRLEIEGATLLVVELPRAGGIPGRNSSRPRPNEGSVQA